MRRCLPSSLKPAFALSVLICSMTAVASADEHDLPAASPAVYATIDVLEADKRAEAKPAAGQPAAEAAEPPSFWLKVPPVRTVPPLGNQIIFPTGPGYYSARECLLDECREKPPKYGYPRFGIITYSFFDADFRYLDDPKNQDHDCFDPIKRIHLSDNCLFSTGGDLRYRYNLEDDSRLSGINNDYSLFRFRAYGDFWYRDCFRVYGEFLFADSSSQAVPPLLTDIDRGDLLNLFTDIKVISIDEDPLYVRIGRQELLYGSQRLISTLDWANVRRTFQGIKGLYASKKCNVDLFCVQPVPPSDDEFDSPDENQYFTGLWITGFPADKRQFDLYYLNLDNTNLVTKGEGGVVGGFNLSTFGARYYGNHDNWLLDLEGMLQFGPFSNQETLAQAFTAGAGYYFKDCPFTPQWMVYYDFASGDPDPGVGNRHETFNQLFAFGHYYLGFIDVVGRQNIHDLNTQISMFPTNWIVTLVQVHIFHLDEARDALYAANGMPIRQDPSGRAGTNVGQEIDFLVNFHLDKHQDIYISYSHLFAGRFIEETGSPLSPDYLYVQYEYRW